MLVFGKCVNRVDQGQDRDFFIEMYKQTPREYGFSAEMFNKTALWPEDVRYIAFVDYEGQIEQVFYIEDKEHVNVYNDIPGTIFNTDGMALFTLIRDCKEVAMWATNHSPWSDRLCDLDDNYEFTIEPVLERLKIFINGKTEFEPTPENVLIVQTL